MSNVFLYIEGGGDSKTTKKPLRKGFRLFLRNMGLDDSKIQIVLCGGRNTTYERFDNACRNHTAVFNMLLVDSEGQVNASPRQHLRDRDNWTTNESEEQYHLMVQAMEAWLIADREALKEYYGQGFLENSIPATQDVEQIEKDELKKVLRQASRNTQKGMYQEIQHGAELLERIDPNTVRSRARYCERLFGTLTDKIEEN